MSIEERVRKIVCEQLGVGDDEVGDGDADDVDCGGGGDDGDGGDDRCCGCCG